MKTFLAILAILILSISAAQSQSLNISTAGELKEFGLNHPIGEYSGVSFDASWNLSHSVDENNVSKLLGSLTIKNKTEANKRFRVLVDFPKRGGLEPFKYLGAMTLKGVANENGAHYSCPEGLIKAVSPAFNGIALPKSFFYCPFIMTSSGAGTMQTWQVLSETFEPNKLNSLGMIADIIISDGDSLTFQPNIIYKPED